MEPANTTAANQKSRRATVRIVLAIGGSFVLLALLIAAVQLAWARHHLAAGAVDLNAAIGTVKSPVALKNPASRNAAIRDLRAAQTEFGAAQGELSTWSPELATLGWVPKYGHELVAASPAASAAYYAVSSFLDIVDGADRLWPLLQNARGSSLMSRIATSLSGREGDFQAGVSAAQQGMSSLNSLSTNTGNASLNHAVAKLRRDLPRLKGAAMWLSVMPQILGDSAPQRILFCWEDSAEIRAVGGFIGAADLVTFRHGKMKKHFTGSAIERGRPPEVRPPVPEIVTTRETTLIFRDSNVSPNFPLSARIERWFYWKDTGVRPNAVVDFVDQGVPDLLSATGPIYLPQYKVTVTSHNALHLATRFAAANSVPYRGPNGYHGVGNKYQRTAALDLYRKQFLGYEFAAIVHRLQTLPTTRWGALGQAMAAAIRRHDILMWSADPKTQQAITATGADGTLRPADVDFLYVVDDNRSYNKIAPYVRESASYHVDVVPNLWLDSTLTLRYHLNHSPSWIEGNGPWLGTAGSKHEFRDFVRVFVPPGAQVDPVPGLKQPTPNNSVGRNLTGPTAYGLTQIAGWFTMVPGQTKVFRISYSIPANDLQSADFKTYRLTVPRQPGTILNGVSFSIQGIGHVRLRPSGSKASLAYSHWVPLTHDQSLSVQIIDGGKPNLVPLSKPSQIDPLIPTGDMPGL